MNRWKKRYSRFKLKWFDTRLDFKGNYSFGKTILKFSYKGIFLGISLLFLLHLFDWAFAKLMAQLLGNSHASLSYRIAEWYFHINNSSIPNLDRLTDTISIGAGVLGVLLGLLYTALITIVATKYSNINSTISIQLLKQKALNRYFIFLSTLTALSIFFELDIALGYRPTLVSSVVFSLLIAIALSAFVRYGKYLLTYYFDVSYLVRDLITRNNIVLTKIIRRKSHIEAASDGGYYLEQLRRNIDTIQTIIFETRNNPQISNTSLDSISTELLGFSIYYTKFKQSIPSNTGWHVREQIFKRWENAGEMDFSLLESTGVDMIPETTDSYNFIEKQIIDAQFDLFHQYINSSSQVQPLLEQYKLMQVTAVQCNFEILEYFFDKLEKLLFEKITKAPNNEILFRVQLAAFFPAMLIAHIVGLNHNLTLFSVENLSQLASAIQNNDEPNRIFQFPYFIRKWMDTYQIKLKHEEKLERQQITPLFYTQYELASRVQGEFQEYWEKLMPFFHSRISAITKKLVAHKCNLEALFINIQCIELCTKINFFIHTTNEKILSFNDLNFQKEKAPFSFRKKEELLKKGIDLNEFLLANIWEHGMTSYTIVNNTDVPDVYGSYYHRILSDLINKLLQKTIDGSLISKYVSKFLLSCVFYLEAIREKYRDKDNIELLASKLFPFIVDLYEVSAILLVVGKIQRNLEIQEAFFNFWTTLHKTKEEEVAFWKGMNLIYLYFKRSFFSMGTSSFIKEHSRKRKFEQYMINTHIVRKEPLKGRMHSFIEHYVTDISDPYIQAIVRQMHVGTSFNHIQLDEIFIEYFLRTRVALKDLNLQETNYGKQVGRVMGK